jgi:hypothetical protein
VAGFTVRIGEASTAIIGNLAGAVQITAADGEDRLFQE